MALGVAPTGPTLELTCPAFPAHASVRRPVTPLTSVRPGRVTFVTAAASPSERRPRSGAAQMEVTGPVWASTGVPTVGLSTAIALAGRLAPGRAWPSGPTVGPTLALSAPSPVGPSVPTVLSPRRPATVLAPLPAPATVATAAGSAAAGPLTGPVAVATPIATAPVVGPLGVRPPLVRPIVAQSSMGRFVVCLGADPKTHVVTPVWGSPSPLQFRPRPPPKVP